MLESLLKMFHQYINEQQQTTVGVTEGRGKSKFTAQKALEALKLSTKAHSLDEFLNLLRLSQFKDHLVEKMNLGNTLEEIAAKCVAEDYSSDFFMQSIEIISRSQANRLCKYLKRNHARRQLNKKKKKEESAGGQMRGKKDDDSERE